MATTHLLIPDTQVKPGVSIRHLEWISKYINDRRPDVIVQIGDFADMASLSSYDKGRKSFEGRRYKSDIEASKRAMDVLVKDWAGKRYDPKMVLTLGNHCNRIDRAVEAQAELEGVISVDDLAYSDWGWDVYPFLEVATVDGIAYSHFFPRAASGKVVQTRNGAPNAKAQLVREGRSCTAGHQQGIDIACLPLAGRLQWGLIAGSCYMHKEGYLGPQGNTHWQGVVLKVGVTKGSYSPIIVDLPYLSKRYKK